MSYRGTALLLLFTFITFNVGNSIHILLRLGTRDFTQKQQDEFYIGVTSDSVLKHL